MTVEAQMPPPSTGMPGEEEKKGGGLPPLLIRHAGLVVLLLTIVAGVTRFSLRDRPPIWGDEAMTFSRVSGDFRDLLDVLQNDGFTPLHYELYWAIGRYFVLSPPVMRFFPALCGMLMVPVIYFLARQMVDKRTSLVAAALAASSAYLSFHAHDSKMYMPFWLLCGLNMGCLLWWLRTGLRVAWLAWVASGLALVGLHAPGMILLGLQPLYMLSARFFARPRVDKGVPQDDKVREWPPASATPAETASDGAEAGSEVMRGAWRGFMTRAALFVVGLLVIIAGPAGYYHGFNRWVERVETTGWQHGSELYWIERTMAKKSGTELVQRASANFLYAYDWTPPPPPEAPPDPEWDKDLEVTFRRAGLIILCICIAGALPWAQRWRGVREDDRAAEPWWRNALWISAWVVLPTYAFYRASVDDPATPVDWLASLGLLFKQPWREVIWVISALMLISSAAWYLSGATVRERCWKMGQLLLVASAILLLCGGIHLAFATRPPGAVWAPRYVAMVWPAVAIAVAVLVLRLPTWPVRWAAIMMLVGLNLYLSWARVLSRIDFPIDVIARDVHLGQDPESATRTITPFGDKGGHIDGVQCMYYLAIESGKYARPAHFHHIVSSRQLFKTWISGNPFIRSQREFEQAINDVRRSMRISRLIVWESVEPGAVEEEKVLPLLGEEWRLAGEPQKWGSNRGWEGIRFNWQAGNWCVRREYVRVGEGL